MTYSINWIRLSADMLHLAAHLMLVFKILSTKSVKGVSLKTQELYALIFFSRYIDIFWNDLSWYLTVMKLLFIISTIYTLVLFRRRYYKTYSKAEDWFPRPFWYLILPCLGLAIIWHQAFTPFEIIWAFSIFLEAVAILPQLFMIQKASVETVETMTTHYIACLGLYRALYLFNWVYRVIYEPDYRQWLVWISGLIQTGLYLDFFYYYVKGLMARRQSSLPQAFAAPSLHEN